MSKDVFVFHSSPFQLEYLRKDSWVSSNIVDSVMQLLMKNSADNLGLTDHYKGWVFKIPFHPDDFSEPVYVSDDVFHMTSLIDIPISQDMVMSTEEAKVIYKDLFGVLANINEVTDITHLLN